MIDEVLGGSEYGAIKSGLIWCLAQGPLFGRDGHRVQDRLGTIEQHRMVDSGTVRLHEEDHDPAVHVRCGIPGSTRIVDRA